MWYWNLYMYRGFHINSLACERVLTRKTGPCGALEGLSWLFLLGAAVLGMNVCKLRMENKKSKLALLLSVSSMHWQQGWRRSLPGLPMLVLKNVGWHVVGMATLAAVAFLTSMSRSPHPAPMREKTQSWCCRPRGMVVSVQRQPCLAIMIFVAEVMGRRVSCITMKLVSCFCALPYFWQKSICLQLFFASLTLGEMTSLHSNNSWVRVAICCLCFSGSLSKATPKLVLGSGLLAWCPTLTISPGNAFSHSTWLLELWLCGSMIQSAW